MALLLVLQQHQGCLNWVDMSPDGLMAIDADHFTLHGSQYLVEQFPR